MNNAVTKEGASLVEVYRANNTYMNVSAEIEEMQSALTTDLETHIWNVNGKIKKALKDASGPSNTPASRVFFSDSEGAASSDSVFIYDSTNKKLGIGVSPAIGAKLHLHQASTANTLIKLSNTTTGSGEHNGLNIGVVGDSYVVRTQYARPIIIEAENPSEQGQYLEIAKFQRTGSVSNTILNSDLKVNTIVAKSTAASVFLTHDNNNTIKTRTAAEVLDDIGAQPLDTDLTTIAGLTHSNRHVMVSNGSSWTRRALVEADLPSLSISKITNLQTALDSKEPAITGIANKVLSIAAGGSGVKTGSISDNGTVVSFEKAFIGNSSSADIRHYHDVFLYSNQNVAEAGILKIVMPQGWTSTFQRITIKGYNYRSGQGAWECIIGGYNYNATNDADDAWVHYSAEIRGSAPFSIVRLGYDGSKCVILLGSTETSWRYAKVAISDMLVGGSIYNWETGWSASIITSETGLTKIVTPTVNSGVGADWNALINKPSTFTPSTHSHPWGDITGKPSTFAPAAHGLVSSTHTVSGLTAGHVLKALSATTYGFAALTPSEIGAEPAITGTANRVLKIQSDGSGVDESIITDDGLSVTVAGNIIGSGADGIQIKTDAIDDADNKRILIGHGDITKGPYIGLYNNERGTFSGRLVLKAGNGSGGVTGAIEVSPRMYFGTRPANDHRWTLALDQYNTLYGGGSVTNIMHNLYNDGANWRYRYGAGSASGGVLVTAAHNQFSVQVANNGIADQIATLTRAIHTNLSGNTAFGKNTFAGGYRVEVEGNALVNGTLKTNNSINNTGFIQNTGYIASIYPSSDSSILYRDVYQYSSNAPYHTGTMKFTLPKTWSNTMLTFTIKGYNYVTGHGAWECVISGYNNNAPNGWYRCSAEIRGSAPFSQVRLAHDGTKCCLLLGNTSTAWSYPQVAITEVFATYSSYTGWGEPYSMSFITSETGIENVTVPPTSIYGNNAVIPNTALIGKTTVTGDYRLEVEGDTLVNGTLKTNTALIGKTTATPGGGYKLEVEGNTLVNGKTSTNKLNTGTFVRKTLTTSYTIIDLNNESSWNFRIKTSLGSTPVLYFNNAKEGDEIFIVNEYGGSNPIEVLSTYTSGTGTANLSPGLGFMLRCIGHDIDNHPVYAVIPQIWLGIAELKP